MGDTETMILSSASSDSGLGGVESFRHRHGQNQSARSFDDDDFELPANWPDYDFQRKKSCLFSRVFCTCVTKAINHLELVQNAIEQKDISTKRGTFKREVRFSHAEFSTDQLAIVGQGGHVAQEHSHHDILEDEVIDEVLLLLARLDRERLRLIYLCEHEQFIRAKLKESIDHWRLKRLRDLPLAVQREHDACITDINELQWHITYNARLSEKMFAKVELSRTWHQQLDIEVSNIRQTTELIAEKVQTESIEIKKISDALKETERELMLSRAKNADILEKAARANQRATLERDEMRNELDKTLKILQQMTNKLHTAQDLHKTYLKTIADAKVTVKQNERTYKEEVTKRDAARSDIANCKLKLSILGSDRENIQFEIQRLTANLERARSEEQARDDKRKEELASLEENALKREHKLEKILKKSREKTVLIDEYERKLEKINAQIDRHQKTLARHEQQRARDADMLRTVTENYQRALYTNESITSDMQRETDLLQKEDDGIRATMEGLRRQIDDEVTMIGMIEERIATDQSELDVINDAEAIRAEHAELIATDLQGKYDVLSECVANLEAQDIKNKESLHSLKEIFEDINEKYLKEKAELEKSRNVIHTKHESTSTVAIDLGSKLEHIVSRSAYMKKHIEEMSESRAAMEVLTAKIRVEIHAAESQLVDVKYNLSLAEAGEREIVRVLQQCLQRQINTDTLNKHLIQERSNYQSEKQTAIENALALNAELASTYRDVLYTYYEIKSLLMGKLDDRLDAVARVKDRRQLIELQTRLHDALNLYLGIKNEYVGQHLDHLNRDSHQNGLKLTHVQETVQSAVEEITKFLSEQVDFEAIHQEAMLKVHRDELKAKQNEQVPA